MSVMQADVNVWFTLQWVWFRHIWKSSSLYNGSDSGICEPLVHFIMGVIQADVDVWFTLQCEW